MAVEEITPAIRAQDVYLHIDAGFINHRLCLRALSAEAQQFLTDHQDQSSSHLAKLRNDHLLVEVLLKILGKNKTLTLLETLESKKFPQLFCSTEKLEPCPQVYEKNTRVEHGVLLQFDFGKPVKIAYDTSHLVSATGTMTLAEGAPSGYVESIVGVIHDRGDKYEIEPLVIGAPWLDHPDNDNNDELAWLGYDHGELLPEDIEEFSKMKTVAVNSANEWLQAMKTVPEEKVKESFGKLLADPTRKDWGGESNDHYSASVTILGKRKTGAFLLKGPSKFSEMTPAHCGKNADQIYRLVKSGADVSIVQHSHEIGEAVRETLRCLVVQPGRARKYCLIDGKATYRILKAYGFI